MGINNLIHEVDTTTATTTIVAATTAKASKMSSTANLEQLKHRFLQLEKRVCNTEQSLKYKSVSNNSSNGLPSSETRDLNPQICLSCKTCQSTSGEHAIGASYYSSENAFWKTRI